MLDDAKETVLTAIKQQLQKIQLNFKEYNEF